MYRIFFELILALVAFGAGYFLKARVQRALIASEQAMRADIIRAYAKLRVAAKNAEADIQGHLKQAADFLEKHI